MHAGRGESFLRGALILTLSTLVARLLGLIYKPLVARIFAPFDGRGGAVGLALANVPFTTYMIILSFTSVGLNVGIARLVAERMAVGDPRGARSVFRASLALMTGLGLAGALAFFFGAPWIARAIAPDAAESAPGFRAMAPALLLTSMLAAYRGLYQGFQQMAPSGLSYVIEQVVRVACGLAFTWILVRVSLPMGAAGFNLGDVAGAAAALAYMLFLYLRNRRSIWHAEQAAAAGREAGEDRLQPGAARLYARIFAVAGPIAVIGAVAPLMMMADTFFVLRALAAAGVASLDAQEQYGLLANAHYVANLPAILSLAVYTAILPAITTEMAAGSRKAALRKARQAYRMTFLLGIPAQAGLWALATGVYRFIYGDPNGGPAMEAMAWAVFPIMLQQTTSGVLQGMGRIGLPVRNFVLGAAVKIVLTARWTGPYGIAGAAWATAIGFGVAALLNMVDVERLLGRTLQTRGMLWKPLAGALVMACALRALLPHLPEGNLALLGEIGAGAALYGLVLLLLRGVHREDVAAIPRIGPRLAGILGRARLLR
ncbi:stage V sporulation protein B [Symbiobacterium terraclitae]|uniref:Stage V sporulation protein B n=2 Tax=Symbiobacterium terraclitae TaxID=557451 RepID=A0ABS4JZP7_9FIRM|nr:polysaccharide biosynthesis protein [Symbiobacterium terraclitae]MBP2019894.1 stage V sporulation protein B [Symbiobacterium terraclitae]